MINKLKIGNDELRKKTFVVTSKDMALTVNIRHESSVF